MPVPGTDAELAVNQFCCAARVKMLELELPMRLRARHVHGFTLIELIVVILIIATLAALLVPAAQRTVDRAKSAQAKNDVTQIVTAVNAYYTEYGKYPIATDNSQIANTADLFYTLRAVASGANTANATNARKIVFISPPDAKSLTKPTSGIAQQDVTVGTTVTIPAGTFVDPWGTTYKVTINGAYDNQIPNPYSSGAGATQLQQGVIVWSLGKDKQGGSGDKTAGTSKDDIISWQ
jgi:prepilin-type N-terminal cleavage/methylation domain-containing protein